MAKIEIKGSPEELRIISDFLNKNKIKHIINDDLNNQLSEKGKEEYSEFIKKKHKGINYDSIDFTKTKSN